MLLAVLCYCCSSKVAAAAEVANSTVGRGVGGGGVSNGNSSNNVSSTGDVKEVEQLQPYSYSHLLRKRHELWPLAPRTSRGIGGDGSVSGVGVLRLSASAEVAAEDLRVVRAMQFASDPADETQRRGRACAS